jgi:AAA domain/DpnII restriction endonuclease
MDGLPETSSKPAIDAFRASLVDDVYAASDFIPWDAIDRAVDDAAPGVERLNALATTGTMTEAKLGAALLEEPTTFNVVQRILAAPGGGVGFADGRQLPATAPTTAEGASELARLLLDVGISRLITDKGATEEILRVALIAADTRRRSNRRRLTLDDRLKALLKSAANAATRALGETVVVKDPHSMPPQARGRLRQVFATTDGRPLVAVATMFEAIGGGRQNQTFEGFIRVQDELDSVPASLILLADGRGVRDVPRSTVERVWERVGGVLSLQQAEEGMLAELVAERATNPVTPQSQVPLDAVITSALAQRTSLEPADLPANTEVARLAMARFEAEHPELNLVADPSTQALSYGRPDEVAATSRLAENFDPEVAIRVLEGLLGRGETPTIDVDAGRRVAVLSVTPTPLIPGQLTVTAQGDTPSADDIRAVSIAARKRALETTIALLVVPEAEPWLAEPSRELTMRTTTTSVVVLDPTDLRMLATSRSPRDRLAEIVLRQADLTKASPFIHNGVTPRRLFAGRRAEEASIVADLASSSVAVLGSRQIGKTSLLRRVEETLRAEGRTVYYGDCQPIGDWSGFRRMANREWDAELAPKFEPDQLAHLVEQLTVGHDPPVVILDEIDRLVAWDRENAVAGVYEAFFRALRAQSQANRAQFVFSGERTIAEALWSPDSPHWNFCQRLSLRQLDRESAAGLLFGVLESLAVRFDDRSTAETALWHATSGHPRLVQLLGDELVAVLNQRPGEERSRLDTADLLGVAETFSYKTEYIDTYWGQARPFERELSRQVASGERSLRALQQHLMANDEPLALRVLELYGIIDVVSEEVRLRAEYLSDALSVASPAERDG